MKTKHKSLALSLRGYVHSVFLDVKWMYGRSSDWKRDYSRLQHELGIKGVRLLTLDFPAIGKHFDMCLAKGAYTRCSLPLTGMCSKRVQVPAFLRGLYLRIFDLDGKLRVAPCPDAILAIRTILMGAKKLRLPYKKRSLHDELNEFIKCEQAIRQPSLNWVGDDLFDPAGVQIPDSSNWPLRERNGKRPPKLAGGLHLADALPNHDGQSELVFEEYLAERREYPSRRLIDAIQRVADIVSSSFGDFHIETSSELPRHGPGVVSDVTTKESKYAFLHWTSKTDAIFPYDRYGSPSLGSQIFSSERDRDWVSRETPSRIIAVPKSAKGPRLIAAEPSAHQWLQQLVLSQLVGRLSDTPISASVRFNDQGRNRSFALSGSVDGLLATIDLSSASDRLSCWSVERFFRGNITLLERLHACRTRSVQWKTNEDYPSFGLVLKKFAPMGSACTFPVQSIIYCCVAVAVRLFLSHSGITTSSVKDASTRISVFGDDIIVPSGDCPTVIQALEYLGLKVNASKTFQTGKFRESCGIDAWGGYDVTPPYILTLEDNDRMSSAASVVEVTNNFFRKGFWNTTKYLQETLGRTLRFIPVSTVDNLGCTIFSYSGEKLDHLKRRYNPLLHREEVRCLVTKSSPDRGPCSPASRLFQWFVENPLPDLRWKSGVVARKDASTRPGWTPTDKFRTFARAKCGR